MLVFFLLNFTGLSGADTLYTKTLNLFAIGLHANGLYNQYNSNFSNFQETLDCGTFEHGAGIFYSYGINIEKEIGTIFRMGIDFDYSNKSGIFSTSSTLPIRDVDMTNVNNIKIDNNIEINLIQLDMIPYMKFNVLNLNEFINFNLGLGFRIGLPFVNEFEQKEVIASPDYVNFISTGTKEHLIAKGSISTIEPINYAVIIKLENILELSKNLHFTQNLSFDYGINDIAQDIKWKIMSYNIGLGIRYNISTTIEQKVYKENQDTIIYVEPEKIIPAEEFLKVSILKEHSDFHIQTGSELLATIPIINAIFFETNSDEIQDLYYQNLVNIPSFFYTEPIESRKYVFLRIKDIVEKNPDAKIHLVGSTSGLETEPEGITLAKKRVDAVKKVFLNLGIPENQITSFENILPRTPSNQDYTEGKLENQRVEIYIKNAQLMEYVGIQKYSELVANIVVSVDYKNLVDKKLILSTNVNDTLKISKPGNYNIPFALRDLSNSFDFKVNLESKNKFSKDSLTIDLNDLVKKEVDINYSLFKPILMFDFGSAELSLENKELLLQLVNKLSDNHSIIIKGSADALGTEAKNIQLSEQRAVAVKDYINKITSNKFNIIVEKGFNKFDESTPEGRFLNRAISIEIRK